MSSDLLFQIAKSTGLFALSSWLMRNRLIILGYHGIWFLEDHYGNHLFMSPDKFKARMEWLRNSRHTVISLEQAIKSLDNASLPPYSTVITIDDGWYGTYSYMLPVLENCALPATLYVYTDAVESQRPLQHILLAALVHLSEKKELSIVDPATSMEIHCELENGVGKTECTRQLVGILGGLDDDQVEGFSRLVNGKLGFDYDGITSSRQFGFMDFDEMSRANNRGLDIQLHTHTHLLDRDRPEDIETEITINREKLSPHVNSSLEHFCYPSGVHSPAMFAYLERNGIKSAVLTDAGFVTQQSHKYALKRILDGENISQLGFEAEMSGFLELVREIKHFLKNLLSFVSPGQAAG